MERECRLADISFEFSYDSTPSAWSQLDPEMINFHPYDKSALEQHASPHLADIRVGMATHQCNARALDEATVAYLACVDTELQQAYNNAGIEKHTKRYFRRNIGDLLLAWDHDRHQQLLLHENATVTTSASEPDSLADKISRSNDNPNAFRSIWMEYTGKHVESLHLPGIMVLYLAFEVAKEQLRQENRVIELRSLPDPFA